MSQKPELLAPAGSWDSLVAAVENGADAVYLGGKIFNARQSAGNFEDREISRAVEFAHIRSVKVYVTVNILLDDRELSEAARFLLFLQQCGADAAIVQDLGLVRLAREVVPELPLHASTQMTVHNLPTASILKEKGLERVVLARELSLEAIKTIARKSGIEVEVFIHGALCVCYSGQCLMSSLIGGRSGNRGRCAQPCRLQYILVDRAERHLAEPSSVGHFLLSPRDLNLSGHLPDLIRAGITSFKIEGRMKKPEYVATVVRIYRSLIDRALSGGDYEVTREEIRDLAQVFNRDFTTGYFYGRPGRELMSFKRPNNRGIRLGRVIRFDRDSRRVEIHLEEPLRTGDGIEVWVTEGGRAAGEVGEMLLGGRVVDFAPAGAVVQLSIPGRVFPGDRVFKTRDAGLEERARASYASPREKRKIPLVFTVSGRLGEPLRIMAEDDSGFTAEASTISPAVEAIKRPMNREYLENQLSRLGNTPFELSKLRLQFDGDLMVPVSEINTARRLALALLEKQRASAFRQDPVPENVFNSRLSAALSPKPGAGPGRILKPLLTVAVTDLLSLKAAVRAGADEVYFGGEQYRSKGSFSLDDIDNGREFCRERGARFILSSPRILQDSDMAQFSRLMEKVSAGYLDGVMATSPGLVKIAREITGRPVCADFSLNVFNHQSAVFLQEAGVSRVTLSPELTLEQVRNLVPLLCVPAEAIVHGRLPLMVSEYCAAESLLGGSNNKKCPGACKGTPCGLKDRKGIVFPLEFDQYCRMHIFNSLDLCVIGDIRTLAASGISALRIEARHEEAGYVEDVVGAYRSVIEAIPKGLDQGIIEDMKKSLAKYSPRGFTKGHYYRGVV